MARHDEKVTSVDTIQAEDLESERPTVGEAPENHLRPDGTSHADVISLLQKLSEEKLSERPEKSQRQSSLQICNPTWKKLPGRNPETESHASG